MTFALSILAFTAIQIAGVSAHGVVGRIKHMADPPFLFPIEVIGELSRILSLSARLFGNVFAGEILLGVMYAMAAAIKIAIIPLLFPVVFLGLEVLFGTIQALVFALLTLIYIMLAAAHDGDHEQEHAEEHARIDDGTHGVRSRPRIRLATNFASPAVWQCAGGDAGAHRISVHVWLGRAAWCRSGNITTVRSHAWA